jgi:hypothetical protein
MIDHRGSPLLLLGAQGGVILASALYGAPAPGSAHCPTSPTGRSHAECQPYP